MLPWFWSPSELITCAVGGDAAGRIAEKPLGRLRGGARIG